MHKVIKGRNNSLSIVHNYRLCRKRSVLLYKQYGDIRGILPGVRLCIKS